MSTAPHRAVRANRKAEILECFAEMVAERGYDEVSLRDIAEVLGMSKGTILHHFGSKDRMLEAVHTEYMARRLAELRAVLEKFDTPAAKLSAIVHQLMIAQGEDRSATVAFAREIVRFASEDGMAEVRGMRSEYRRLVGDVVRQGMDEGLFARTDPEIITLQVFGMCNWSWTWFRPNGPWTPEDVAGTFVRTLLFGLQDGAVSEAVSAELEDVPRIVRATMAELATNRS